MSTPAASNMTTTTSTTPASTNLPITTEEGIKPAAATTAASAAGSNPAYPPYYMTPVGSVPISTAPITGAAPFPPAAFASLYVGQLHPDVTESMLFELFNQVGPVASIRVCRDAVSRRSLGYAYVNFHNAVDGERALDTLNYTPIKGQPCRIMWSQRDPSLRRSGMNNLFIKSLDKSIDDKALHDTFSAFGNILSCKVVQNENGSKGFGFVHFETQEAAEQAIAKVNGMLLNDKMVYVAHHIPRRDRISKIQEMKARFTNVYVKNLDESIDDEELIRLFKPYGEITSAVVQRDDFRKSKCFGFVNYADHASASKAVEEMNEKEIKDKTITVCRAQSKSEREEELRRQYEAVRTERLSKYQGVNLYVKNLEGSVDDEQLRNEFMSFGTISSCKVMREDKGVSKGFGFVCFSTSEEAQKALAEMNGKMINAKPIYVALAQRKEDRRSVLEAQFAQRNQFRMAVGMGGIPMYYPGSAMYMGGRPGSFPNSVAAGMMYPGARVPRWMAGGYPNPRPSPYFAAGSVAIPASSSTASGPVVSNVGETSAQASTDTSASTGPLNLSAAGTISGVGGGGGGGGNSMMMTPNGSAPIMMNPQMMSSVRSGRAYRPRGGYGGHSLSGAYPGSGGGGPTGSSFSARPAGSYGPGIGVQGPTAGSLPMMSRRGGFGQAGYRGGMMMGQGGIRSSLRSGTGILTGNEYYGPGSFYPSYPYGMPMGGPNGPNASSPGLPTATFVAAPPEVQKQILGERLYPFVAARESELASKITGMLLEMDNGELIHLLESPDALSAKVAEAVTVLQQHASAAGSRESKGTNVAKESVATISAV